MPQSAEVMRRIIRMLQQSVKFVLPNCCNLFDPEDMKQAHLDLVRLPYPCVTFEAPWEKEDGISHLGDFQQSPATRRIALCWELREDFELLPGLNDIAQAFPEGGVFVLPIYWGPEFQTWTVALGGAFFPYSNLIEERSTEHMMPASLIANAALAEAGRAQTQKQYRAEPFFVMPEMFAQAVHQYGSREKAYAQIMLDSGDETMMLIQASSVLNCANVVTANVEPSAALNKKREAKGKQPFFTYKVLQLSDDRQAPGGNGAGGTHASPRMHLRRGHLRRLENKTIWVRPSMVNASSAVGIIAKDYAVRKSG